MHDIWNNCQYEPYLLHPNLSGSNHLVSGKGNGRIKMTGILLTIFYAIRYRRLADPDEVIEWALYGDQERMRPITVMVFTLFLGVMVSLSFSLEDSPLVIRISLFVLGFYYIYFIFTPNPRIQEEKAKTLPEIIKKKGGVIYILRRSDEILKFGKTISMRSRISAHNKDYQMTFTLVTAWFVSDIDKYETLILRATSKYAYREGNRKELRDMSDQDLQDFILSFTEVVQKSFREIK